MTNDTLLPFDLPSVCRKKITVDFNGDNQSSDGGLLLLREKERTLGVCWRLANTMTDRRDPNRIRHEMFEMVMARVSTIGAGRCACTTISGSTSCAAAKPGNPPRTKWPSKLHDRRKGTD